MNCLLYITIIILVTDNFNRGHTVKETSDDYENVEFKGMN